LAIELVISGGQSGAVQAGLRAARTAGIMTGGTAPRGWLAEIADVQPDGAVQWVHRPCPWLANLGLVECSEPPGPVPEPTDGHLWRDWVAVVYPPRTRANVADSDATIWFGSTQSRGYATTHHAALAREPDHPFLVVFGGLTRPSVVRDWLATHRPRVLNVAGNRESGNPGIGERVEAFLSEVFRGGRGGRRGRISSREGE
jgi:hypothetical protein